MLNLTALDDRINKCKEILEENPDSQIFAAYADALRKNDELDHAFRVCRQGLRIHSEYGAGHMVMARINFDRKMFDWAESELAEAIKFEGRTRSTDQLRAEINIKKKNFVQASIILEELMTAEPDNEYYLELLDKIDRGKLEEKKKKLEMELLYKSSQTSVSDNSKGDLSAEIINLEQAIKLMAEIPEMKASFIMDQEGLMIESVLPESFDSEAYAALSSEIYRFANSNIGNMEFGKVKQVLIELAGEKLWMIRFEDHVMVLVVSGHANLGSLKLKLMNILKRVKSV